MKTTPDCLLCLMRQSLKTARLTSDDKEMHHRIIARAGSLLQEMDLSLSPPENAVSLYQMIAEESGREDPFAAIKKQSNELALALRQDIAAKIRQSQHPLRSALHYAACGNIIDHAAQHHFDVNEPLRDCEKRDFLIDDYNKFSALLDGKKDNGRLLYLADNCGEIVFDGLLIEQIQARGWEVTLVVRSDNIINDATMSDAANCGLNRICEVVESGAVCPGTPLRDCSEKLQNLFHSADCILAKGMGNFETLSEIDAPLFFLFTIKCPVVAEYIAHRNNIAREKITGQGEMILLAQQ